MVDKLTTPPKNEDIVPKINEIIDNLGSGGGGSAPVWGNITGTLSDQTDLQNVLDDKYDASNPNGYTSNIGTVTSVNNTLPDANGNVALTIPDTSNFVTINTAQTITGAKTMTGGFNVSGGMTLTNTAGNRISIGSNENTGIRFGVGSSYTEELRHSTSYYSTSGTGTVFCSGGLAGWGGVYGGSSSTYVRVGGIGNDPSIYGYKSGTYSSTLTFSGTNLIWGGNKVLDSSCVDGTSITYDSSTGKISAVSSGSVDIDNTTITQNASDELQTVAVIDDNSGSALKTWVGTLAEYNAIATKDSNTVYNVTDDQTALAYEAYTKTETNTLLAAINQTIQNELYYKSGDTLIWTGVNNSVSVGGLLTSSSTNITFCLPLPKRLDNVSTFTVNTLILSVRKVGGGYLPSATNWEVLNDSNAILAVYKSPLSNMLVFSITYRTTLNETNNTPLTISIKDIELVFS